MCVYVCNFVIMNKVTNLNGPNVNIVYYHINYRVKFKKKLRFDRVIPCNMFKSSSE